MAIKQRLNKLEQIIQPEKEFYTTDDWIYEDLMAYFLEPDCPPELIIKAEKTDWSKGKFADSMVDLGETSETATQDH